jgi:restriction endonuclease S subunit
MDFKRVEFNKSIGLNPYKKKILIGNPKWQKRLGDICNILIGGTPSRKISEYFNGTNLWVSIAEMNGEIITNTKEKISDSGIAKSNVKLIQKGTTLLSFKLSIGKTAIAGKDLYTNEAIAGLIPKDKNISNEYLFQLFNSKIIDLEKDNFNTFGKSLNSTFLREEVYIPVPDIDIQEKIVKECELIDDEVQKVQKENQEYKKEIQTRYQELFNNADTTYKLSDETIFEAFIGKRVLAKDISQNSDDGIRVYSANVYEPFGYTKKEFLKDFSNDSVLWGIDGDWMVNHLEKNIPFYPTDHCGVIRVLEDEKIEPKYLSWVLEQVGNEQRFSRANRASTARIKVLSVKAPDYEFQKDIVSKIKVLETKLKENDIIINSAKSKKEEILRKYL